MAKRSDYGLQVDYVFRGAEHVVRMTTEGNLLEVEVEDRLTTDQWRGEFDAPFIEDLTHKTGNFKQFGIFCSMLESALAQSSESVTLDLLTYADLEALRNRKIGVGPRHPSATKASPLNSKRYLILIYSVEFDRQDPLPTTPALRRKADPVILQKEIRELKEELAMLKAKPGKDFRDVEIRRLREELQRALEEKQLMESVLLNCREDLQLATSKGSGFKEVKILKKVVQTLEEQLTKERAKHQRLAARRLQESRQLADELAEVKATERSLRIRVKNLTNELALYKKGLNRTGVTKRDGHRSASGERSNSQDRSVPWGTSRQRSSSRDGCSGSQGRISRQSPSPTGIRAPRFDPTAFVKAKERKQKEVEQKNQRNLHRAMGDTPPSGWYHHTQLRGSSVLPGGSSLGKPCGRSSSVESFRSKRTSASSGSEMEDYSEPVAPRGRKRLGRNRKAFSSSSWNGPTVGPRADNAHKKRLSSTPNTGRAGGKGKTAGVSEEILENSENLYEEPSADLSEIDARLQALQEYMNKLETQT